MVEMLGADWILSVGSSYWVQAREYSSYKGYSGGGRTLEWPFSISLYGFCFCCTGLHNSYIRPHLVFILRAVGEKVEAAESVGINPRKMKYIGLLLSGLLCSFGGAFLSLSYLNMFSENMTAGRGWLALAAINFGKNKPVRSLIACLIFGFADALALRLQQFGLPSQLVLMLPYVSTLVVLVFSAISDERKKKSQAAKQRKASAVEVVAAD